MRERVDLDHLVRAELEVEDRGIFREPLQLAGARDDDDLLLHQEAQAHLRRALAMPRADARQHRAVLGIAARNRAIGHDRHAVGRAGLPHLRLINEGMQLDLIAYEWLARQPRRLLDQRDCEIRYADVARKA